jgi:glucose/mannose-6-phosphate isomerase
MSDEPEGMLDQPAAMRRRDPGNMLGHAAGFAHQLRSGWQISRSLQLSDVHRSARAVAVLGMGGSAVCADIARAIFADRLSVPVVSVRDYQLPAWVDSKTLVVAVSHSGATEETIAAFSTALERRCPAAVITTGGAIGDVAARVDLPRLIYPGETPPRASLGYTLALLAGLLERAGYLDLSAEEVEAAAAAAAQAAGECAPGVETAGNPAKQLAWTLLDRLPVVEGSGALAAVARRWKTQLNENSKSAAAAEELPEAMHNTVVGYAQPDTLRDHLFVCLLAGSHDHARNARRAELTARLLDDAHIGHQLLSFSGPSVLAEACSAISLGDFVSIYLALLYGEDPSATPVLGLVKDVMGSFDELSGEDDQ